MARLGMAGAVEQGTGWKKLAAEQVADCRVFTVERQRFEHFKKEKAADFFVVRPSDWAVAMGRLKDGRWLVIRQFRFGRNEFGWEFPSGCAEVGEDPMEAATREFREETGFEGRDPVLLGRVAPNPAIQDNTCSFVYFKSIELLGEPELDEHEEIEVRYWEDRELRAAVHDGRMSHALMLTALYLYDAWVSREMGGA